MLEYLLFIVGLVLLVKGADWLVDGSSSLAKRWGIPSLVIGLTVVALGTSLPELGVNIIASLRGNSNIAFGNIVGSNIANLLLVLGIAATISALKVQHSTVWKEIPFSLLAAAAILAFAVGKYTDGSRNVITRFDGIILLLFLLVFLYYVVEMVRCSGDKLKEGELSLHTMSSSKVALLIIGGLIALVIGGRWVVDGASALARLMGMSEYFISLTIISIGTSLPELVTSIIAALKHDVDIAIGNAIGSNIFNIFLVLGLSAIINPVALPAFAIADLAVLILATVLLFTFMHVGTKHTMERWEGIFFISFYAAYIVFLVVRG